MTPEERFEAWVEKAYPYGAAHGRVMATAKEAYLAGLTAGAEDMRERAAKEIERKKTRINGQLHAALVRALPTQEKTDAE